VAMLKAN
jgi:hypothetical protein